MERSVVGFWCNTWIASTKRIGTYLHYAQYIKNLPAQLYARNSLKSEHSNELQRTTHADFGLVEKFDLGSFHFYSDSRLEFLTKPPPPRFLSVRSEPFASSIIKVTVV